MQPAIPFMQDDGQKTLSQWAEQGMLYALLDPHFDVPEAELRAKLETKDTDPVFYEVIAWDQVTYQPPTLVKLTSATYEWIRNSFSTERWGVFIAADCSLETLARHFQKFVIARGPDGNPYFLRFHDSSVLDVLLGSWEAKEKNVFFGPASGFGLPDLELMKVRVELNPFSASPASRLPIPEDCLLQLREPQLRACGEAIDRDLVRVVYWHLRNHHPKVTQFLERETLEDRVHFAITKARRYGLGAVSDLAGFAALMFELAPNFDDHPSFRAVLADAEIAPEQKMRKLSQVISDREWSEAMRLYDRAFWPTVLHARRRR